MRVQTRSRTLTWTSLSKECLAGTGLPRDVLAICTWLCLQRRGGAWGGRLGSERRVEVRSVRRVIVGKCLTLLSRTFSIYPTRIIQLTDLRRKSGDWINVWKAFWRLFDIEWRRMNKRSSLKQGLCLSVLAYCTSPNGTVQPRSQPYRKYLN